MEEEIVLGEVIESNWIPVTQNHDNDKETDKVSRTTKTIKLSNDPARNHLQRIVETQKAKDEDDRWKDLFQKKPKAEQARNERRRNGR